MTEQVLSANWNAEPPRLGMQALWRLPIWGGGATFALFMGVISVFFSGTGSHRQTASAATGQTATVQASPVEGVEQPRTTIGDFAPGANENAEETRRLAEAVRTLAADRDQLLSRIAALERDLDGVTGTIKHDRAPTLPPPPLQPPPSPPAAVTAKTAAPMTEAAAAPAPTPASQRSAAGEPTPMAAPVPDDHAAPASDAVPTPAATGAGLGVDIGGAGNYEGLRTLWRSTKNSDPALLGELYPVVAVRENGKTHGAELRLVIGPLDDAESAARLCATLATAHHYCQPVAFEGQRISMTDAGPTKAQSAPSHHSTASSPAPKVTPTPASGPVIHFEK
jgi:hypothetical protein